MMNSCPGKILRSSAGRPAATVRARMSWAKSRAASNVLWAEKITSAWRAAKSRPSPESPAWNSTGCFWGLRGSDPEASTE